jgi:hypothetical protein
MSSRRPPAKRDTLRILAGPQKRQNHEERVTHIVRHCPGGTAGIGHCDFHAMAMVAEHDVSPLSDLVIALVPECAHPQTSTTPQDGPTAAGVSSRPGRKPASGV